MFGLPGAALAMIREATASQKKIAVGILSAAGLTAFITGITEPLEFAFMFVAFPLYVIHALLTGLSLAIAYVLDIHLGFSFSAGLIDLLLYGTAPAAKNIPLLVGLGVVFFALYYVLFRFAIRRWNLRTPGREADGELAGESADLDVTGGGSGSAGAGRAEQLISAFGGRDNLRDVDACITRLRIEVADKGRVDKAALRALGAAGVIEVGNNVQAIFGTQADALKTDINNALAGMPSATTAVATAERPVADTAGATSSATKDFDVLSPVPGRVVALVDVPDKTFADGLVGNGVAVDPPREPVVAVAPVSGKVLKLWPHAYVVVTDAGKGVLTHLGLDTVQLKAEGFEVRVAEGDRVEAGQPMIAYDVPAVEAAGRNPIVPVVVMDTKADRLDLLAAAEARVAALDALFSVRG
jgi:PTS system N-acetylglucosamine-specific IIC component